MWQAAISRPSSAILFIWRAPFRGWDIAFHFSDLRLSLHPQCCLESLLFYPISISQSVWGVAYWVDQAKYLNWLLTQIVMTRGFQGLQFSWGRFWKCARGVTTSMVLPKSQLLWVLRFNFVQCLWWKGCCWEWARWTNWTGNNPAMDMPLLPAE